MLSYETQLDLKRDVIVKAYKNFSSKYYLFIYSYRLLQLSMDICIQIFPKHLFLQYSLRWDRLCNTAIEPS